ncbi:MAG: hypothetical protein HZA64_03345 [Rhodocyclales bacterium]|jgi:hypothetical protein|nr:hypothetical protein [Rhodocyclales bacterium]
MAIDPQVHDRILAQLGPAYAHAYPKILEQKYPHILEKIASLTSPVEIEKFFENLMLTQRTGRQGFPVEVFDELMVLIGVFRKLHLLREPPKQDGDVWSWVSEIGYEAGEHHNE